MDIRIDRCVLHGPAGDVRRAQRILLHCPWPPAAEAEVLILRRIDVRARPQRLPARLYQAAGALMAGAIDGWSEAATGADCVRFRSEADMLARLSLDLAAGRAADLWFWQSFRCRWPAAPAHRLAALWIEETPRLPAIVAILRERRALLAVWRRLDEPAARELLHRIIGPAAIDDLQIGEPCRAAPAAPWERLPAATPAPRPPPRLDAKLIAALNEFATPVTGRDQPPTAKDHLALVLAVAAEHPHWLAAPDTGPRLRALRDAVAGRAASPAALRAPSPSSTEPGRSERTRRPPPADVDVPAPVPPDMAPAPTEPAPPEAVASDADRQPGPEPPPAAPSRADTESPLTADAGDSAAPLPAGDTDTWHIAQGGLFYLLNLLNWRPVRERLFADPAAMAFPGGWGWLYRLGERLALEPELPLIRCLARLSGLPETTFPADLPPLPAAADIATLGAERYARFGLWHPRLLQMPALVRYRRPELDIHYAMADLDIAVRSAALDVDPGWLDWLGTLVRFHYVDAL